MRTIKIKKAFTEDLVPVVKIIFDDQEASATWKPHIVEDMEKYHPGIDVTDEIVKALVGELDFEFTLTEDEKVMCLEKLSETFK